WCSLVELEVWGDEGDAIWIPDDDFARRDLLIEKAIAKGYAKKVTWQETLVAAYEGITKSMDTVSGTQGFTPYVSPTVRAGKPPLKVDVSVAGLPRVWLETDAAATWGDPVLVGKDGETTPLTALKPLFAETPKGKPLAVETKAPRRGIRVAGVSRVCYKLDGKYERLTAWASVGRRGAARMKVLSLPSSGTDPLGLVLMRVERDFRDAASRREMAWETEDRIWASGWTPGDRKALAARYAAACNRLPILQKEATALAKTASDDAGLAKVRTLHHRSRRLAESLAKAKVVPWQSLRLAVADLSNTFGDRYPRGAEFLQKIDAAEAKLIKALEGAAGASAGNVERLAALADEGFELYRTALLANPLLSFDKLLLVRRKGNRLGLPANWCSNSSTAKTGYDNQIATMSISAPEKGLTTIYSPPKGEYVGDVDLHYDAERMLFSMPEGNGGWHVHEVGLDGKGLRKVTHAMTSAANNYDACYLPDDRIIFTSTAGMVAVPCVNGSAPVATLFRMNADGSGIRQLCFDQEHSWYPAMMGDGRVLYTRWEYADLPHSNSRMLFTANPDGTNQRAYYGSGSFWPNSIFYARAIPGHATKVVGTVTGHHAPARMGELIIFDPAKGSQEADGVVQRIPGYGKKVEPLVQDGLTGGSWPKFLHPYPLNEHYFLVSAKLNSKAQWGIYLVDIFDNILPIKVDPTHALLEPFPLVKRTRPPVIPDRVDLKRNDAV
ncbi:hypothetical protein HQ560_14770, partial [bacterium]|nr:hypothetical protein [bacterium]